MIYFDIRNMPDIDDKKGYFIYATGTVIETENQNFPYFQKIENYSITVDYPKQKRRQKIKEMDVYSFPSGGYEGGITLYWIGDLNGDNKLDILAGISDVFHTESLNLYISSSKDELFDKYLNIGFCAFD